MGQQPDTPISSLNRMAGTAQLWFALLFTVGGGIASVAGLYSRVEALQASDAKNAAAIVAVERQAAADRLESLRAVNAAALKMERVASRLDALLERQNGR